MCCAEGLHFSASFNCGLGLRTDSPGLVPEGSSRSFLFPGFPRPLKVHTTGQAQWWLWAEAMVTTLNIVARERGNSNDLQFGVNRWCFCKNEKKNHYTLELQCLFEKRHTFQLYHDGLIAEGRLRPSLWCDVRRGRHAVVVPHSIGGHHQWLGGNSLVWDLWGDMQTTVNQVDRGCGHTTALATKFNRAVQWGSDNCGWLLRKW